MTQQRERAQGPEARFAGASIEIQGLTVKYGDVVAVDSLDLDVAEGQVLVLLGPSGCGKSSTLRALAGLEVPHSGRVSVGGEPMFDSAQTINLPPHERDIGMVFQSYAIWPHMTVAQNVGYPLKMAKRDKGESGRRVDEMLELVGLGGLGHRGASLLSGGQMQRVALARSLVMEPRILLLDEPLSNLDAKLRTALRFELRTIQQKTGVTSVYVTHDQAEALALADQVAVMRDGLVEQYGPPEEIYRSPVSTFVADFMGIENMFSCAHVDRGGRGVTGVVGKDNVKMSATAPLPHGADGVSFGFRSSHVELAGPAEIGEVNVWPARLSGVNFLGTHMHFVAEIGPSSLIHGAVPEHNWDRELRDGSRCHIRVAPERIHVLAE